MRLLSHLALMALGVGCVDRNDQRPLVVFNDSGWKTVFL